MHPFMAPFENMRANNKMLDPRLQTEFKSLLTKLSNSFNKSSIKHIDDWVLRFASLDCTVGELKTACDKWVETQKFHPAYSELKHFILMERPDEKSTEEDKQILEAKKETAKARALYLGFKEKYGAEKLHFWLNEWITAQWPKLLREMPPGFKLEFWFMPFLNDFAEANGEITKCFQIAQKKRMELESSRENKWPTYKTLHNSFTYYK